MYHSCKIFLQFLRRDCFVYRHRLFNLVINYSLIYPLLFSFAIGYVQAQAYFGSQSSTGSIVFIGHILIIVLVLANTINTGLLFDLEQERFIDYQITLLNPRLVLLERIIFTSLLVFFLSIPFYPLSKIVLGSALNTQHTSWPLVFFMLYLSSLCCSAYTLFAACVIKNSRFLRSYWMRVNFGLITLGGLFIPLKIIYSFSPVLGILCMFNPMLYITEGLRQSILNDPAFLPAPVCAFVLIGYTILFTTLAWVFFKKRVDHI